ncbi:MAG: diguanylate cyclase, partial [Marinobacter sp. 34-60-7]
MFLLLLLVSTLAWAEPDRPSPDIVTIGVVADNEPYVFFEGRRPTGFSIDVLRLVGEQSNVVFDFRAGSWPEIFSAFQRGDLDAIDGISWRPDRAESILFTDPYHVRGISMMADSARSLPVVNEVADLNALRVGVVEDIFYISELEDAGIEPVTYDSIPSLVRALAYGWIDVAVGPELTLTYTANRGSLRFLSIIGNLPLTQFEGEDFRIGVRTDNPVLSKRLQDGLQAIPRRQINDLLARWQDFGGALARVDSGTTLSASQQQYLDSLGPIRVGFMEDYAPFSFTEGGRVLGLSVDVMDRPEREQYTRFSRPYYAIPNVIFTRDPDLDYNTLTDLREYRVGLGVGIFYENAVRETLDAGQITTYDAQEPMYRALARGDVDVVIGALHTGNFWIHQLGMSGARIAGELILPDAAGEDLRFGVRPSLAPLADILSQTMERLTPTEQRVIETRWLGASSRPSTNTTPTWSDTERAWLAQHGQDVRFCVD